MEARVAAVVAEWTPGPGAWLLVWLLKGSLLLALLFPLATLLRRSSSSARHLLWTAGLAVTLALPLASMGVLPWRLEVPVLPEPASPLLAREDVGASQATVLQSDAIERTGLDASLARSAVQSSERPEDPSASAASTRANTARASADRRTGVAFSWSRIWSAIGWLRLGVLVWAAGTVLLLVQLGRSAIHTRRLVRDGTPLTDAAWRTPLIEAADRLDLPDIPRLLVNPQAAVPLTCGIVRPSIVLPTASAAWTDARRRAVLCHELGHVRRRDLVSHLLGRLTCALYWFQPLAWSAARRMRAESERACDDLVLLTGTRASAYADHLLEIAAAGRGGAAPVVALPMAQPREFEARLLSILEADKRREPLSRVQAAVLAGLVLIVAQPLVALTPSRMSPALATPPNVTQGAAREAGPPVSHLPDQDSESRALPSNKDSVTETPAETASGSADAVDQPDPRPTAASSNDVVAPQDTEVIVESVTAATVSTLGRVVQSFAGQTGQADPHARAGLIEALSDPAPEVRRTAAWSLSTHSDSLVVHALARALRSDEDERVREMSAWALAQLDAPATDDVAIDVLSHAVVSDASAEVRASAAWALSSATADTAVSALERAVQVDTEAEVREAAAWALGTIGAASSAAALSATMTFEDADVRETAAWAIGTIEPDRAPDRLIAGLRDVAPEVREASVWALGRIGDPRTAAALQEALSDDDAEVRSAVIWALGSLPNGAATEALTAALRDPDPEVRAAAAAALGGHGSHAWPWPRPRPRPRPQP